MEEGVEAFNENLAFNELEALLINQKFIESELLAARVTRVEIVKVTDVVESLECEAKRKAELAVPGNCTYDGEDIIE